MKEKEISTRTYNNLLDRIALILVQARTKVVREINRTQVLAYWEIGREIVEFEQKGKARSGYGEQLIERLSKDMTPKFGRGFSPTNIKMMRLFYQAFPIRQIGQIRQIRQIRQTLSDESSTWVKGRKSQMPILPAKSEINHTPPAQSVQFEPMLSWSHYCELLKVEEPLARSFYEQESIRNNWSVRELKRQINSILFERLAHSKDIKAVMKMAKKGQIIEKPEDAKFPNTSDLYRTLYDFFNYCNIIESPII